MHHVTQEAMHVGRRAAGTTTSHFPFKRNGGNSDCKVQHSVQGSGSRQGSGLGALSVESLVADTSSRKSADQAIWYTGPTWPCSMARIFRV